MYSERIDLHADFLDTVAERKFNMGIVACVGPKVECVSVGCAMGWTPNTFPELVRWAFTPEEVRKFRQTNHKASHHPPFAVAVEWREDPDIHDQDAMELLFGISSRETSVLFGTGFAGYSTPKEVARGLHYFARTRVLPNEHEYLDMLRKEQGLPVRRRRKAVVNAY